LGGAKGASHRKAPGKDTLAIVLDRAEVFLPLGGVIDVDAERRRLDREITETETFLTGLGARLQDQAFLDRAPADVVEKEREKLAASQDKLARLKALKEQLK